VNLLKSKFRRTTAVVAGSILGLAGVVALAAPASAHHSVVSGTPHCDTATGEWVVDWQVDTYSPSEAPHYRFIKAEVTPSQYPVSNIAVTPDGADPQYPNTSNEPLKGEQRLPGTEESASLTVKAQWNNYVKDQEEHSANVEFDGTCSKDAPKPDAELANTCEGVTVTLFNGDDAKVDAVFSVKGTDGFVKEVTVKPGQKDVTVDIPAKNADKVVVTEKNSEKPVLVGKYEQPKDCQPEDKADRYFEATCDALIFTIDNTKGEGTVTATFTPNKGEAQTLTVKGGEKGSVTFKGEKGLEVKPSEHGQSYDAINWDSEKPKDCDKPSASATPSTTPVSNNDTTLPVTGAAAGGIAGGAAVLLAIGAVLFVLARRRKVKFTA
jgi:hypothetical protein